MSYDAAHEPERLLFERLFDLAEGPTARVELCRVVSGGPAGEMVAVKRLKPEVADIPDFIDMFRDEMWMASALRHPHVAQVVAWGEDEQGPYLAVEFVRGVSLARLMRNVFSTGEEFTERLLVYLAKCVADGLVAAHELQSAGGESLDLVHRDLTPANILMGFDGKVKITDFGLAKAKQRITMTALGVTKGEPAYMSPEQITGQPLDGRSDLFSLGVVLFEALAKQRPWNVRGVSEALQYIVNTRHPDLGALCPKIDRKLVAIVDRCLEKDRSKRWSNARELKAELERWLHLHGYRDTNEWLARFVRRNALRQMRWLDRAIAAAGAKPESRPLSLRQHQRSRPAASSQPPASSLEQTSITGSQASYRSRPPHAAATTSSLPAPHGATTSSLPAPPTAPPAERESEPAQPARIRTPSYVSAPGSLGESPRSNATHGNATHSNATHGNATHGNATHTNATTTPLSDGAAVAVPASLTSTEPTRFLRKPASGVDKATAPATTEVAAYEGIDDAPTHTAYNQELGADTSDGAPTLSGTPAAGSQAVSAVLAARAALAKVSGRRDSQPSAVQEIAPSASQQVAPPHASQVQQVQSGVAQSGLVQAPLPPQRVPLPVPQPRAATSTNVNEPQRATQQSAAAQHAAGQPAAGQAERDPASLTSNDDHPGENATRRGCVVDDVQASAMRMAVEAQDLATHAHAAAQQAREAATRASQAAQTAEQLAERLNLAAKAVEHASEAMRLTQAGDADGASQQLALANRLSQQASAASS